MTLRIKSAIKLSGKTQAAVADAVPVSRGYMSDVASGKKTPSLDTLQRIADILGVAPSDLYDKPQVGFAEGAESFIPTSMLVRDDDHDDSVQRCLRGLTPGIKHRQTYRATQTCAAFGILSGDLLIVELNSKPVTGDIVVATKTDTATGEGTTELRRWANPWLIPADAASTIESSGPDGIWAILGAVRGTVRITGN